MIIGVTGDTHNNLKNIEIICRIFNENSADLVFHTGDVSLPKSLLAFKDLNCPLITILGNNDVGEREALKEAAKSFDCKIFDEPYFIEISKKKFVVLHHPDLINHEIVSENDYIIHGHTHRYRLEKIKDCFIFNPGECAGMMKGKNQVGIIELDSANPKIINF